MLQEWFVEAKLGIFIHWGIYAVKGTSESWAFYNGQVPYDKYMDQIKGFTASKYNSDAWADLIKKSGARYAILSTKHHDGVALWDTKANDLSTVKKSPASVKGDLINPFCKSMRKKGIKLGLYFSLIDWSNPDYSSIFSKGQIPDRKTIKDHPWEYPQNLQSDYSRWKKFVKTNMLQIKEIMENYNPDLMWFDGSWTRTKEEWESKKIIQYLHKKNPNIVINSRIEPYGDYSTPEIYSPIFAPKNKWELCTTINDSWGFRHSDNNYKTADEIVRIFIECISQGGNLLLDIGPKEDGTIDTRQEAILIELGKWIQDHKAAVFGTGKGIPLEYFNMGLTTLSHDKKRLYLIVFEGAKHINLKGIRNKIKSITHLKSGKTLSYKKYGDFGVRPGYIWIQVGTGLEDHYATVIEIKFEDELLLSDDSSFFIIDQDI